jgi:hypothetical protein
MKEIDATLSQEWRSEEDVIAEIASAEAAA